jgi:hypothetical protein
VRKVVLVKSPGGEMKATLRCPMVKLNLRRIDFQANLLVLNSSSVDVILGMDRLTTHHAVIQCSKRVVLSRTKSGEIMEVKAILLALETSNVNLMKGATLEETKVVKEYPQLLKRSTNLEEGKKNQRQSIPISFDHYLPNLEDEIHLKGLEL